MFELIPRSVDTAVTPFQDKEIQPIRATVSSYFTPLPSLYLFVPALQLKKLILKLLDQIVKWFKCATT